MIHPSVERFSGHLPRNSRKPRPPSTLIGLVVGSLVARKKTTPSATVSASRHDLRRTSAYRPRTASSLKPLSGWVVVPRFDIGGGDVPIVALTTTTLILYPFVLGPGSKLLNSPHFVDLPIHDIDKKLSGPSQGYERDFDLGYLYTIHCGRSPLEAVLLLEAYWEIAGSCFAAILVYMKVVSFVLSFTF